MTRKERLEKLKLLDLIQAKDVIVKCHEILDRAGVGDATHSKCDDMDCEYHLTHRLNELVRMHQ